MKTNKERFIATLLGGAIGDALGYPVEFMVLDEIKANYGKDGITNLVIDRNKRKALISDDTQMTLFTADGMIWAHYRCSRRGIGSYTVSGVYPSYLRWYYTQTKRMPNENSNFFLTKQPHEGEIGIMDYKELFFQRAPGLSCLSALESGIMGTMEEPINDSKGCGGVMRVAPVGLFLHNRPTFAFEIGAEVAAITHGHPTGYLTSGVFSMIIAELISGKSILESTSNAIKVLKKYRGHEEVLDALSKAIDLANSNEPAKISIKKLGEGWVAEEALAIALYCSLKANNFKDGLIMAVNHDGDSDSTGAICGNILGAKHGNDWLPEDWLEDLELKDLIINIGEKLYEICIEQ